MAHISDIKLIRTDTTLDLSQKAEKELDHPPPSKYKLCHLFEKESYYGYIRKV
ncbi:hypothetical protein AXX17_AT1G17600 [Arabidopsis thaliana]|uniref:Uncharacterized protein n=1 Tax=Arabidopsis thaliana TaxID=3702 RepID=A0A178WI94_ARATH|nr:hypothetical protein AXX17_AT1G17600 [Arabidopsis thaliana]